MDFLRNVLSPITITFLIIGLGYLLGRIKIYNISLDLAGVLIIAIIVGCFFEVTNFFNTPQAIQEIDNIMKTFSSLGTALFVSVIGITAGYSLNASQKKDYMAFIIGIVMAISGFVTMKIINLFGLVNYSELLGAFCGALTSTPGLSVASEMHSVISQDAVLGYGSTYLFGVVITVLSVQIISKNYQFDNSCAKSQNNTIESPFNTIMQICLSIVLGDILGKIKLPILKISLGNSGGILCAGILIGFLVRKLFPNKFVSKKIFSLIKSLGLAIFFVGTGLPAGMKSLREINIIVVIYGIIMTMVPILVGWVSSALISKERENSSILIAGGMTSTPAIGVLTQKGKIDCLHYYSLSYIGALLTIIILVRFS